MQTPAGACTIYDQNRLVTGCFLNSPECLQIVDIAPRDVLLYKHSLRCIVFVLDFVKREITLTNILLHTLHYDHIFNYTLWFIEQTVTNNRQLTSRLLNYLSGFSTGSDGIVRVY